MSSSRQIHILRPEKFLPLGPETLVTAQEWDNHLLLMSFTLESFLSFLASKVLLVEQKSSAL